MSRGREDLASLPRSCGSRGSLGAADPKGVPPSPGGRCPSRGPRVLPLSLGFAFLLWLGLTERISAARALPNSSSALAPRTAPPAWLQKLGEKPAFLSKSGSARSRTSSGIININRDDAHRFQPGCREGMLGLRMRNYVNLVDYPFMCSLPRAQRRDASVGSSGCGRPLPAPP